MHLPSTPAHGYPDDDDDGGEEQPPFVLIEPYAYFADRDNATTATCEMTGFRGQFKVTFCTARPPLVSYMCFHSTAYGHAPFAFEPEILATETNGSRVLLRLVFGTSPSSIMFRSNRQYLVYDARGPTLEHLPHPGDLRFSDDSIAFVRKCAHGHGGEDCSTNCAYVLAAHSGGFRAGKPCRLCLYHSDTRTWQESTELVLKQQSPYHSTWKAITIGGDDGTVAWVDLWHNIVLCDVLAQRPELRALELPRPILDNAAQRGSPRSLQDIAVIGGSFKYVQMQVHRVQHPGGCPALGHWEWDVTVFSTKTGSSSADDWVADYELKSSEIPEPSPAMLQASLGEAQPTLSTLLIGLPNLSLQDAGIVYFLSKVHLCDNDHTAWVLALDMRSKTIQKVGKFSPARTLGLAKGYDASDFSKFLKGTKQNQLERPGTPDAEKASKKPSSMAYAGTSMVN